MNTNNKAKYHDRLERIIKGIQLTADKMGVHPSDVTKAQFLKHVDNVTSWDIREVGGIAAVKKAHFPVVSKDLVTIREQKETARYISDLEKQLAQMQHFNDELAKVVKDKISVPKPIKPYKPAKKTAKKRRQIIGMLNDVHYGLKVVPEEVGGTNKFGWQEASRRTALYIKQLADYKIEKRDEVECLHLVLNGDLIQGVIHDLTARTAELLVHQVNGSIHILYYAIAHLAANYKKVVVHGVPGNHDDSTHRREGGRVTSHKYDSYVNVVYFALSAMFQNQDNVEFYFPKSLYGTIDLPAGRIAYTHGDTLFSTELGNPSRSLNTRGLGDAISRFNNGEIDKGEDKIRAFLFGHVHSHTEFTTYDGVKVFVAPSLSGVDPFAASLGINHNQIGQILFESTDRYLVGDKRVINLSEADDQKSLDKIIPVFKNELSWKK